MRKLSQTQILRSVIYNTAYIAHMYILHMYLLKLSFLQTKNVR